MLSPKRVLELCGSLLKNDLHSIKILLTDTYFTKVYYLVSQKLPMDAENHSVNLLKAAKELNIGLSTAVEILSRHGISIDAKPNTKLSKEAYSTLCDALKSDAIVREEARQIVIGKIQLDRRIPDLEMALRLIKRSKALQDNSLDLGRLGLSCDDFKEGTILYNELKNLSHLSFLSLSNTKWVWDEKAKSWTGARSKNSGTQNSFSGIPKAIETLKNLETLHFNGDEIEAWSVSDISVIKKLKKLKYLDLGYNSITNVKPVSQITGLKTLVFRNNNITDIKSLTNLKNLVHIDLSSNKIVDISTIFKIPLIEIINVNNNNISSILGARSLSDLKELYLNENKIENIEELRPLIGINNLKYLDVRDNPFTTTSHLKLLKNENHFDFIKEVLLRSGRTEIRAIDSNERLIKIRYPVKILMLGNHGSGKSSLVNLLSNDKETGSTHVLRITSYIEESTDDHVLPKAIFFDFGGQDFYHGVYQVFMSDDCLQIILFNKENNRNSLATDVNGEPTMNFDIFYWIGQNDYQKRTNGNSSQFIIGETFSDKGEYLLNVDYHQYEGFLRKFHLCLSDFDNTGEEPNKTYFQAEQNYFKAYLDKLIAIKTQVSEEPYWYVEFLRYIFDKSGKDHNPTSVVDLLKRFNHQARSDHENLTSLKTNLTNLHRHGLVLYYRDIDLLSDVVWLNPQELVRFIQNNIFSKNHFCKQGQRRPGIVSKEKFEQLVIDDKLLELLKAQNVIFLHSPTTKHEDEEYIIPNFLPVADSDDIYIQLFTFGLSEPNFVISFLNFIPFGFVNHLICFFGLQPDVKRFWRDRLIFTLDKVARVSIELDFGRMQVLVTFKSLTPDAKRDSLITEYLFFSIMMLYWGISKANILSYSEFKHLKENIVDVDDNIGQKATWWNEIKSNPDYASNTIYISIDGISFVNYLDLFAKDASETMILSYKIDTTNKRITSPYKEIELSQFNSLSHKDFRKMKNIFISYSKFDETYLQEFEDHLVTLKKEGLATFTCRNIEFGKEWDEEIKRYLDACDIVVCLISVKFLNTDYITKIEIPRAIEQNKIIVPIIIKACDWESSDIGRFQATQRGKIVSLDSNKGLYGEIKSYTAEERAAAWTAIIKEFRSKLLKS